MWRILILTTPLLLSALLFMVYADNQQPENAAIVLPCLLWDFTDIAWAELRVTEVWFDGSDEWIEITNIGPYPFSGSFTVTGVKSQPLAITTTIQPLESIILWDTLVDIAYGEANISGQWLSLPDSTGFSISLLVSWISYDSVIFSATDIATTPNLYSMEAIFSWKSVIRYRSDISRTQYALNWLIASPWVAFCVHPEAIQEIDTVETWDVLIIDPNTTGSMFETWSYRETGWDMQIDDTLIVPVDIPQPPYIMEYMPCEISEIHAVVDTFPEYVEIYCSVGLSGTIDMKGIGVWETIKHVPLQTYTWWYSIIASSLSGFASWTSIILLSGVSLRDDGEVLSMSMSWYLGREVWYDSALLHHSFYPSCVSCTVLTSPWFSQQYVSGLVFASQVITPPTLATTIASSSSASSSYYEDLYRKRKATAQSYQTENTSLKKEVAALKKAASKMTYPVTTTKTEAKSVSTTTSKAAPKSSAQKQSPKTTATTQKSPTISTTSKAYQILVNEHTVYKNYVAFIDNHLKNHLYTQYNTLWLSWTQVLLATSLKHIRKQQYVITWSSFSWEISVFDFQAQRKATHANQPRNNIYRTIWGICKPTLSRLYSYFLENKPINNTLFIWQNRSHNDTWNDTMGIKTLEMSSSPLE